MASLIEWAGRFPRPRLANASYLILVVRCTHQASGEDMLSILTKLPNDFNKLLRAMVLNQKLNVHPLMA
jgi:hypothetical protein